MLFDLRDLLLSFFQRSKTLLVKLVLLADSFPNVRLPVPWEKSIEDNILLPNRR